MASSKRELTQEVLDFGQYRERDISKPEVDTAISRAKRHIRLETRLPDDEVDWYGDKYQEDALFWCTILFSKVIVGDLDSKAVSVGAINESELLANGDDVTLWYQNYRNAKNRLAASYATAVISGRTDRTSGTGGSRNYDSER